MKTISLILNTVSIWTIIILLLIAGAYELLLGVFLGVLLYIWYKESNQ